MPIGIMGSKIEVQGDSVTRNKKERILVFVLFETPSGSLKQR